VLVGLEGAYISWLCQQIYHRIRREELHRTTICISCPKEYSDEFVVIEEDPFAEGAKMNSL
jgi:hypothetical protein